MRSKEQDINRRVCKKANDPVAAFKPAIATGTTVDDPLTARFVPIIDPIFRRVIAYLEPFMECYPQKYQFKQYSLRF